MRQELQERCQLFIRNRDVMKEAIPFEYAGMHAVGAAIFTDQGKTAQPERLRECRKLLKSEEGLFSSFRSYSETIILAMMAAEEDPAYFLRKAQNMYQAFKDEKFWGSSFLSSAAAILARTVEEDSMEMVARKAKEIYGLMKQEHPFLTGQEDSVFAAMLALSPRTPEEITEETELCYEGLRERFHQGDSLQSLSHVLALAEGTPEEKCGKTIGLFDRFKEKGSKYGRGYELASLGVLALLPADLDQILDETLEVDEFLSGQKGYGILGHGRTTRLMHAGMIVSGDYVGAGEGKMTGSVAGGLISSIIVQQAALCAAIAASSSAAASNSHS